MQLGPGAYAAAFVASSALAWVLTPVMLRVAVRRQVLDVPDERKAQDSPVPYLGGIAIVIAFAITVLVAGVLSRPPSGLPQLAAVLGMGLLLAMTGLLDDLRGLSPYLRLAAEVAAGLVVYFADPWIRLPGPTYTDLALTVVWVVGVTNAFNLLDNMDGLSAGAATIAAMSFCVVAGINGQYLVAALAAAVAGCASGFLRHNFHPAKIYMGDAGSLFLGFLLSFLAIRLELVTAPPQVALFVPVLILGVALFDTTLVTFNRLRHHRSPMQGGLDHASHRLVWVGIPVPISVGIIYGVAASLGFLAVLLARLDAASGMMLVGFVLVIGLAAFVLLSAVPVYDTSHRRSVMLRVVREHEPEPPAGAGTGHVPDIQDDLGSAAEVTRTALITGITGQDGSYLAELLLSKGYAVHGLIRRASTFNTDRIDGIYQDPHEPARQLFLHHGDLSDGVGLVNLIRDVAPDEVYHLGAQSHVKVSFEMPEYTGDTTGLGTIRLLDAIRAAGLPCRFYQASSSEMYGSTPPPQNERTPFHPRSPYGCAKVYAYWATVNYREAYDLFCVNGILFNHESPRRGETFVTRKITRAVARIAAGLQDKLYLGNLDAVRDWGYAPEYVEGMWRMLQHEYPTDYVLATGEARTVRDFAAAAFARVGLDWERYVEVDSRYERPAEVESLIGDASKAAELLRWEPRVRFEHLVQLMVDADVKALDDERAGRLVRIDR